jgi:protoheme IX farnesyltransferase
VTSEAQKPASAKQVIARYYWMAKPGIVYGNGITAVAGFLLGARGAVQIETLAAMVVGISLVMASACVFNNYLDRDLDRKMERTKWRALAAGTVSGRAALIYGTVLGVGGFAALWLGTNLLAAAVAAAGFVFYAGLYTWSKRRTVHGTLVGSVSGAVPPVVGYVAATGRLDLGAWLVFAVLVTWQMPHFYAIAVYRLRDYQAAGVPVLPAVAGVRATKIQIAVYVGLFMLAAASLTAFGYAGLTYWLVMMVLGVIWLRRALEGFRARDDVAWARGLFRFSLVVLMAFSLMISLTGWIEG